MWEPSPVTPHSKTNLSCRISELQCHLRMSQGNTVLKRKATTVNIRTHSTQGPSTMRFRDGGQVPLHAAQTLDTRHTYNDAPHWNAGDSPRWHFTGFSPIRIPTVCCPQLHLHEPNSSPENNSPRARPDHSEGAAPTSGSAGFGPPLSPFSSQVNLWPCFGLTKRAH